METGNYYFHRDRFTSITTEAISFGQGETVIALTNIRNVTTSAPWVDLDWTRWRRTRYKWAAGILACALVAFFISAAVFASTESTGAAFGVLGSFGLGIIAIIVAGKALLSKHPERRRHYYLILHLRNGGTYERYWLDYDTRERIRAALNHALGSRM